MARLLGILSIFALLVLWPANAGAPPCSTVTQKLASCLPYIENKSGQPDAGCCNGVKGILGQATSQTDKVAICNCIKSALAAFGGQVDPGKIRSLPQQCGMSVHLPPIDKNFDCSKINWMISHEGSWNKLT